MGDPNDENSCSLDPRCDIWTETHHKDEIEDDDAAMFTDYPRLYATIIDHLASTSRRIILHSSQFNPMTVSSETITKIFRWGPKWFKNAHSIHTMIWTGHDHRPVLEESKSLSRKDFCHRGSQQVIRTSGLVCHRPSEPAILCTTAGLSDCAHFFWAWLM